MNSKKVRKNYKTILVMPGNNILNKKGVFCGWLDPPLSPEGRHMARQAGYTLRMSGYKFDIVFTSVLQRGEETARIILEEIQQPDTPVVKHWRLNERHFGSLTGLSKEEVGCQYGDLQYVLWRRSYNVLPPAISPRHPCYQFISTNPNFTNAMTQDEIPATEALEQVYRRTIRLWNDVIVEQIKKGKNVLIVGHNSSLRSILKKVTGSSELDCLDIEIPAGIPLLCNLSSRFKMSGAAIQLGIEEDAEEGNEVQEEGSTDMLITDMK